MTGRVDILCRIFEKTTKKAKGQMLRGANYILGSNCSNVKHGDFQLTTGFGVYVSSIPRNFIVDSLQLSLSIHKEATFYEYYPIGKPPKKLFS